MYKIIIVTIFSLLLVACFEKDKQARIDYGPVQPRDRIVAYQDPLADRYHEQVKPILENRCVVCHGCYDAPCQLKLSSPEGIERGLTPESIYATRFNEVEPSRLLIDHLLTQEWRDEGYKAVLNERDPSPQANLEQSVLFQVLTQKVSHPLPDVEVLSKKDFDFSLAREQQCPDINDIAAYQKKFPLAGMPYGLPNLQPSEFSTLVEWIELGSPMAQAKPLTASLQQEVQQWEQLFNGADNKSQLINRYIYEHLFLGHIYFSEKVVKNGELPVYFRLVRSLTPPGTEIKEIPSRRPFDDPKTDTVYYRLRQDTSTVLSKTHMPYALNSKRMNRWNEILYQAPFTVPFLPSYKKGSNPFKVFASIPVDNRYQFMLDEAEFTIMGFIKGPVCRGQTALNVIQDKFWVLFTEPNYFKNGEYDTFIYKQADNLELPSEYSAKNLPPKTWNKYAKLQKAYIAGLQIGLAKMKDAKANINVERLWKNNDNASLTIFRNVDSAVVVRGLQGKAPKTAWVIDYPVLERIHYLLVAGYDVYGTIGHQLITRLYMDFLRIESEMAFIITLPKELRQPEIESWYVNSTEDLNDYLNDLNFFFDQKNSVVYKTEHPKKELFERLKIRYKLSDSYQLDVNTGALAGLNELPNAAVLQLAQTSFIVIADNEKNQLFTLLRHNERTNVATLLSEKKTRLAHLDTAEVFKGLVGSYPQIIFKLDKQQIAGFVERLQLVDDDASYNKLLSDYAIRRTNPEFWQVSDLLHETHQQQNLTTYGLLDYNRLENR